MSAHSDFDGMARAAQALNDEDYALETRDDFEARISDMMPREKNAERLRRSEAMDRERARINREGALRECREICRVHEELGKESRRFDPHIGKETDFWTQDGWTTNRDPSGVRNDL